MKLWTNDKLNFPSNFVFYDCEADITDKEHKFILAYLIEAGRVQNELKKKNGKFFEDKRKLWEYIAENNPKDRKIIFAHNQTYDFQLTGGMKHLINMGWKLTNFWNKGTTLILQFEKEDGRVLNLWDSMNYVRMSLAKIGESLECEKMEKPDFKNPDKEKLKPYCKNDVKILFKFISKLVDFLYSNRLSKLKSTASSIAFNTFIHCSEDKNGSKTFYRNEKTPIIIHNKPHVQKLELKSYKGGLTEILKRGDFSDKKIYKLDINSMYPSVYIKNKLPRKLDFYKNHLRSSQKELKEKFYDYLEKDGKDLIARIKLKLTENKAFIQTKRKVDKQEKAIRLKGKFEETLCTPELEFVENNGKILEIKELAGYDSGKLFDNYGKWFYKKRLEFRKENNEVYELLTKLFLNSLYGKFAQRKYKFKKDEGDIKTLEGIKEERPESCFESFSVIDMKGKNHNFMQIQNDYYEIRQIDYPSKKSFVPISSYITSKSRMNLVKLIFIAGLENVFYTDTDSLFVNEKGFENLKKADKIDFSGNKELGKLEIEGISEKGQKTKFLKPKWYIFNEKEKHKGEKSDSEIIKEDSQKRIVKQEQFRRLKKSMRNSTINVQIVELIEKEFEKSFKSGKIGKNGKIIPLSKKDL